MPSLPQPTSGALRQVALSSARRVPGANLFEQGAGQMQLPTALLHAMYALPRVPSSLTCLLFSCSYFFRVAPRRLDILLNSYVTLLQGVHAAAESAAQFPGHAAVSVHVAVLLAAALSGRPAARPQPHGHQRHRRRRYERIALTLVLSLQDRTNEEKHSHSTNCRRLRLSTCCSCSIREPCTRVDSCGGLACISLQSGTERRVAGPVVAVQRVARAALPRDEGTLYG